MSLPPPADPPASGFRLVRLAGGAFSLRSLAHQETFHPVLGPAREAEALYLNQLALRSRLLQEPARFAIWDVGLGAAGNALAILHATRDLEIPLHLASFDCTLEPLEFALEHAGCLGYFGDYAPHLRRLIAEGGIEFRNGRQPVRWELHRGDFPALLAPAPDGSTTPASPSPRAILWDAYSPATNPAMWTLPLFALLHRRLDPAVPCSLATYSRSTMLRATLLLAGFYVGRGHATGEKEETTVAATHPHLVGEPLGQRWLQRVSQSTCAEPLRTPAYSRAPISPASWQALRQHPQFQAGA